MPTSFEINTISDCAHIFDCKILCFEPPITTCYRGGVLWEVTVALSESASIRIFDSHMCVSGLIPQRIVTKDCQSSSANGQ